VQALRDSNESSSLSHFSAIPAPNSSPEATNPARSQSEFEKKRERKIHGIRTSSEGKGEKSLVSFQKSSQDQQPNRIQGFPKIQVESPNQNQVKITNLLLYFVQEQQRVP